MRRGVLFPTRLFAWIAISFLLVLSTGADSLGEVRDILRRPWANDDRSHEDLVSSLSRLRNSTSTLFRLYSGELRLLENGQSIGQNTWWCDPDEFHTLYLDALGHAPVDEVIAYLKQRSAGAPSLELRVRIVNVYGALGSSAGVDPLMQLAGQFEPLHLQSRTVRTPLVHALASIFRGDSGTIELAENRLDDSSDELTQIVFAAVKLVPSPDAIAFLERRMDDDSTSSGLVLNDIAYMHDQRPWLFEEQAQELVRPYLFSDNWQLRRSAVVALAKLRDLDSLFSITLLIDDENDAVVRSTVWSLQDMSCAKHDKSSNEWSEWIRSELDWWEANQDQFRIDLRSDNPSLIMAAIRTLSTRSLFRDQAAQALSESLFDSNQDLVVTICRTLEQLDSRTVVPALVNAYSVQSGRSEQAIRSTLNKLTGADLGDDIEAWRAYIE